MGAIKNNKKIIIFHLQLTGYNFDLFKDLNISILQKTGVFLVPLKTAKIRKSKSPESKLVSIKNI